MAEKDIITKEIIARLAVDLATYLLGLSIEPEARVVLQTEHQRVEDRHADLVVELRERGGDPFILHIEIQNNNDRTMPLRMLRYMTDILLSHPALPLRQYLIYIGHDPLTMPDGIDGPGIRYRYGILNMQELDCRYLLEKDTPDTLVLAILCNFGEHNHQAVVNHIFTRLQSLLGNDHKRFREYVEMLHVLSVNRDIDKEIKEAEKMLTQVDIERIPAYQPGMERGMERGIEEGIELGQGKGEALFLLRLLGHKFGPVPAVLEERIGNARHEELALWGQRVLNAKTFDEVFSSS